MECVFQYVWVFPFAIVICVTVCTAGIEGAILFVPFFSIFFPMLSGVHVSPVDAIKIGLFTEIFGFTSSFFGFWRAKLIDFHIGWLSVLIGIPLAVAGGILTYALPPSVLLSIVAGLLAVMGFLVYRGPVQSEAGLDIKEQQTTAVGEALTNNVHRPLRTLVVAQRRSYRYRYGHDFVRGLVVALGGLFEGLVGFGIGAAGITDLVLRRIPLRVAIGTSHMVIMWVAFAAVSPHAFKAFSGGQIPWNILIWTVPAVSIGGQIAPKVTGLIPQEKLKRGVAAILILLAVLTFYRSSILAPIP